MSEKSIVEQILNAIYWAWVPPHHRLVVKMSDTAWARLRIEAQPHLTGMVRFPEARIAGCEILLAPWLDDESWELLSVEPTRLIAGRTNERKDVL